MTDVGKFKELQEEKDRSYGKDSRTIFVASDPALNQNETSPESRKRKRPEDSLHTYEHDSEHRQTANKRKDQNTNTPTGIRKKSRYKT